MVIVLIRTALRADADPAAYEALGAQMYDLVTKQPGFLGATDYASPDGAALSVIRFASREALHAWREHPEHLVAQHRGRTELYASYHIEVCEVVRAYGSDATSTI